jgi:hypothetical protein
LEKVRKRNLIDRRKRPTPALSRYTFFGRRRTLRRKVDQKKGGYVDRYDVGLFLLLILIAGLNVLDSVFSKTILNRGGWEVNPIVRVANELWGDRIWIWKIVAISGILFFLYLHSKFRWVEVGIMGISCIYTAVVLYQIFLYLSVAV